MQIGRRIYYETITGNVILETGERTGDVVETTVQQDFSMYAELSERNPETVGVIQLAYGQYAQDFAACSGYRVDVSGETPTLVFSYPDPSQPDEPPVYRPPLSEELKEAKNQITLLETKLTEQEAVSADQTLLILDLYEMLNSPT
jgi:hypothetical protein